MIVKIAVRTPEQITTSTTSYKKDSLTSVSGHCLELGVSLHFLW